MHFDEDGNLVFDDQAQANACPTDPMEALECESCQ